MKTLQTKINQPALPPVHNEKGATRTELLSTTEFFEVRPSGLRLKGEFVLKGEIPREVGLFQDYFNAYTGITLQMFICVDTNLKKQWRNFFKNILADFKSFPTYSEYLSKYSEKLTERGFPSVECVTPEGRLKMVKVNSQFLRKLNPKGGDELDALALEVRTLTSATNAQQLEKFFQCYDRATELIFAAENRQAREHRELIAQLSKA